MSRRGSVLENYRVPDLTNPINPLAAHEMVSRERMHGQELEQTKQRQKAKAQEDRDKGLDDLKITPGTSGTIYDPTGLKETQELNTEIMAFAKANPDKSIPEIKMMFAPRANRIARFYQKSKTIAAGVDAAVPGLNDLGGYNIPEVKDRAIRSALIDPVTGKIREDVDAIDELKPWWAEAIKAYPMETTTGNALSDYVNNPKGIGKYSDEDKFIDKNKGFTHKKLELNTPAFIQIERDSKGAAIKDENGKYVLEPKYEMLPKSDIFPDGVKVLSKEVFDDLKATKPAAYQRIMGEVANYIKTNNNESDDNIAPNSVEAENIARMLLYGDIKAVWGNRGVTEKDIIAQPPAQKITINNNSGGTNPQAIYNDTWGRIKNKYAEIQKEKIDLLNRSNPNDPRIKQIENNNFLVSMQNLDTEAINLISKQVNEGRAADKQISPDDMYVNFTTNGEIKVYKAKKTANGKEGVIDKDYLIATLPPSSNLKAPQANTKSKVSAQEEAKQREEEIKNQKGKKVYKIGNKEFTEEQLQKGADKNKMSLADYKKSIGL